MARLGDDGACEIKVGGNVWVELGTGALETQLVASWWVCMAELVVLGELWRSNNGCSRMGKKLEEEYESKI